MFSKKTIGGLKMKKKNLCSLVALLLLLPCSAFALEFGKLRINGFLSQGYMESQDNNFLDPDSMDGTFEINEIGLTVNSALTDKLSAGAQLLSRDLGPDGNNDLTLDWAYVGYHATDWAGIRAGKLKLPIGLYNETRDSDFLRPMAFLPQSIYDEMQRSFITSAYGASLYGNIPAGSIGDFDYQLFYGEMDIDEDNFLVDVGLKEEGIGLIVDGISGGMASVNSFDYEADKTLAASLIYNTPLDGLRFGLSYFKSEGKFDVTIDNPFAALDPGLAMLDMLDYDVDAAYDPLVVVSAEYAHPLFTVSAEYMERDNEISAQGLAPLLGSQAQFVPDTSMGWYVMGTVQVPQVEGLSVSALYDVFYLDKDNTSETNVNSYRKDLGLGARYDINANWLVKAEWHTVEGAALNMDIVNDGQEDDWSYFIVKTSFNF
jgi:hypothetical protein